MRRPSTSSPVRFRALAVLAAVLVAMSVLATPAVGTTEEVGMVGPSYYGASAPTADKPQSKLWYADGQWWGSLFDPGSQDFHIFGYDWAQDRWVDTGVLVDGRVGAYTDTLWDGQKLYIAAAGAKSTVATHGPVVMRFSYSPATRTWSRDSGFPVTVTSGGVEAALIEKDSTGLLWMTFTKANKVMLSHTTPGDDRAWVAPYELPTDGGESRVDPDDISAVVAYDGDKIGVLWSNQITQVMYWAVHEDGTGDQNWSVESAYAQPEGADDHMNLKSLTGDDSGRVFAVTKTSMDKSADPLINLLALKSNGDWRVGRVYTKADDVTRAIVQIDTVNRKVYVFVSGPCCSGGDIYYKRAGLSDLSFPSGKGTLFMHSHANPKVNNPTSTKQTVTPESGLLVLAGDDSTRRYVYNRLDLPPRGGTTDTTPPETTITSGPPAATESTSASFTFSADEDGSTFSCRLDGGPADECTSPWSPSDLSTGTHQVAVAATDSAGNTDPTPAVYSWTVVPVGVTLFTDDFSSGGFAPDKWVVTTGGNGTAEVVPGAVRPGDLGAQLTSTTGTGSTASLRTTLPQTVGSLSVSFDAMATVDRSGTVFALLKLHGPGGGSGPRVLTLQRVGKSGMLQVQDSSTSTTDTGVTLPLDTPQRVTIRLDDPGTVVLSVDGTPRWSTSTATLGNVQRVVLGESAVRRKYDLRVDSVLVTR